MEKRLSITFNTPGSNRTVARAKALLDGAYSHAAGLGTKRKTVNGWIREEEKETVVARLKILKCTSIKIQETA